MEDDTEADLKFWIDSWVAACCICVERYGDREERFGEGVVDCPWLGEGRRGSDRGCVFWVALFEPVEQTCLRRSIVSFVPIGDSERLVEMKASVMTVMIANEYTPEVRLHPHHRSPW